MKNHEIFMCGALLVVAGTSCGDGTGPELSQPGIHVVAAPAGDTIDAEPVLALTVEARDDDRRPAAGLTVRFESIADGADDAWALVGAIDAVQFFSFVADEADERGRASVRLKLGRMAGAAKVRVTVPELGMADTVQVTVQPGAAARAFFSVRDTAVMLGMSFPLTATVGDRYLNPVSGTPTIQTTTPSICSYASPAVTAIAMGRCVLEARYQEMRDTARATVVLPGRLAVVRSFSTLDLLSTDGADRRTVLQISDGSLAPAWSPDGGRMVIYEGDPSNARLSIIDTLGNRLLTLGAGTTMAGAALGRFSADGQWVYFTGRVDGMPMTIWRMKPDGSDRTQIVTFSASFDFGFAWRPSVSPDGSSVAFDNGGRIAVVNVATGEATDLGINGVSPAFSPDGSLIAYISRPSNALNVMSANGTNIRVISQGYHEEWQIPQWTSDGAFVLVNSLGFRFVNVADGTEVRLSKVDGLQASLRPPQGR